MAIVKPLPKIGVDMFYFAKLLTDNPGDSGPTYDTPMKLPGLVSIQFNPNAQSATFYADNGSYSSASQLGDLVLTVGLADIPLEVQATWFGQKTEDGVLEGTQINPMDMAIGYRVKNSDGGYRYFWFKKCKAAPSQETVNTQGNSIAFQTDSITITCTMPLSDGIAYRKLDDTATGLPTGVTPAIIAAKWFTDPMWDPQP